MEPYNPNLPFIRFANDGKTVLDRLVESGIPFTRALQYFRDNPEGNALEFFKLIGEDVIPFYGNYRNGGDVSDYAKEAFMLAMPLKKRMTTEQSIATKQAIREWNEAVGNMKQNPSPQKIGEPVTYDQQIMNNLSLMTSRL